MTPAIQALAIVVMALWIARDAFSLIANRSAYVQAAETIRELRVREERGRAFLVAMVASRWAFEVALMALMLWVLR